MVQQAACILAGVFPGQSPEVVREAGKLASALGYSLVCAYSNPARYVLSEAPDGSVSSSPIDPDFADDTGDVFPASLTTALSEYLHGTNVAWRTLLLAGDPAHSLARCAATVAASMIVVGTHREAHTSLRQVFNHSVAAKLARQQHQPVLVIPVHHTSSAQP